MNPNNFNNLENIPQMPGNNEPKINRPTEIQKMNDPFFQNNKVSMDNNLNTSETYNYNENVQKNTEKNKMVYKYLAFLLILAITGIIIYFASTLLK